MRFASLRRGAATLVLLLACASAFAVPAPQSSAAPLPFHLAIRTAHDAYKPGAKIKLTVSLVGDTETVTQADGRREAFVMPARLRVLNADGNPPPRMNAGKGAAPQSPEQSFATLFLFAGLRIKPGRTLLTEGVVVTRFFDLIRPGNYTIEVIAGSDGTAIHSNALTITIAP